VNIKKLWEQIFPVTVLFADLGIAWISAGIVRWLWFEQMPLMGTGRMPSPQLTVWLILMFVISLALIGNYRRVGRQPLSGQTVDILKAALYSLLTIMVGVFLSKGHHFSRGYIFLYFGFTPAALLLGRALLYKINIGLMRLGWGVKNAVIVGNGRAAKAILDHLMIHHTMGYRIMGFLVENPKDLEFRYCGVRTLGLYTDCESSIGDIRVEEVFIPDLSRHLMDYNHIIDYCRCREIEVRIVSQRTDLLAKAAGIYDMAGITLFRSHNKLALKSYRIFKRLVDVVGTGLGLLLLLPLFGLLAVLIKMDSPGPVFFKQGRLGEGGRDFKLLKFRTMFHGAEEIKHYFHDKNEADGPIFKIRKDPRITRAGRWLRRLSLDELPQVINVFRGEMSLVGPRPPLPSEVEKYQDWHKRRLAGPQGMTGLWQVSGRSELSFEKMVLLDLYYLENCSPVMDIEILFKTIPAVILGSGAY